MILDKNKIRHRMIDLGIERFTDLAEKAEIGQTTLFVAMDTDRWRASTIASIARALECSPFEILTVTEQE